MFDLVNDLRSSVRSMLRRPVYPAVAVGVLAIGLSASVAVFTYINGFYQPFPGADADGLVRIFATAEENAYQNISWLDYQDYAAVDGPFEGIAATQPYYAASVRLEELTEVAFIEAVSGDLFSVLDVPMSIGRGVTAADDQPGADAVAVLSHEWWVRSFNADPGVIGSTIYLNFRPFVVVGVAAPEFLGTTSDYRPAVWIPFAPFRDRYVSWANQAENRDIPLVRVYARLRDGVRPEQARSEFQALAGGLDAAYPRVDRPRVVRIDPATWIDPATREAEWSTVRLMMAAAIGLLLLVCANVANLLLSVAVGRQREVSLRAALGASPGRLVRQVLIENVLLATIAGAIGLLLAGPAAARLGSYFARPTVWGENVSREVTVDGRVVLFAIAVALLTGVLAGLLPAIRASRRNLLDTLKAAPGAVAGAPRRLLGRRVPGAHDTLVTAQVALAVLLLVVAGLVVRTFVTVGDLDPGFAYDPLVVTHISTSSTTLQPEDRERFFREVAQRVAVEPWARAATVADYPLLSPHPQTDVRLDGQVEPARLVFSNVIPGFFEALGIDVVQGRSFATGDTTGARVVAVVNESLQNRFFPDRDAIGRRLWMPGAGGTEREYTIVGVVRDTKTRDFVAEPEPTVYRSYPQHAYPTGSALLVAAAGDPAQAVPQLHRWLREFEPHLAIVNVVTYRDVVRGFLYTQRMNAELFSVLAVLGLGLAAVGIFSIMSLAVSRRTREIGIRMSIGASRRDIGRLVIGRTLAPVALGLGVGLLLSFAVSGVVRSLLFGVEPTDSLTLATGTAILLAAALVAAWLPAHRAARVDPLTSLRRE